MAEFILVDRHRIHRIPQPHIPRRTPFSTNGPASPFMNGDIEEDRDASVDRSASFRSGRHGLTLGELALLPLSGVPAYRAVRTLLPVSRAMGMTHRPDIVGTTAHPFVPPNNDSSFPANGGLEGSPAPCRAGDSRPRALVLRAHDGPGALAVQMLVREGWCVWAHVPVPFALPGPALGYSGEARDEEEEKVLEGRRGVLRRLEERLRGWGVDEVLFIPVSSSPISASQSSPSVHTVPRSSSSSAPSTSPSPFSMSGSGGSPVSSPVSSPYSHVRSSSPSSSGEHNIRGLSISSCFPVPFLQPYTFTPLPLPPYDTEQDSAIMLLAYLERAFVRVDAILDTIGGRSVWEAGRALLARPVRTGVSTRADVEAQFTTLVGDAPNRVVASAGDNFRAGVRTLRIGGSGSSVKYQDMPDLQDPLDVLGGSADGYDGYDGLASKKAGKKKQRGDKASKAKVTTKSAKKKTKLKPRTVNYTWVSLVSDIDWEGDGVCDTLRSVLQLAVEYGVRPAVGQLDFPLSLSSLSSPSGSGYKDKGKKKAVFPGGESIEDEMRGKIVPFENTPNAFMRGGGLECGGTVVSRIVG